MKIVRRIFILAALTLPLQGCFNIFALFIAEEPHLTQEKHDV